ncbi:MAG: DUF2345 domain-containing protein, partial [Rhodoferax sp.]|uniref:DUF2345 domain-containing protein n=1 Tax=Rhodoferax sp. TaxID=50421 RepID=UPI003263DCB3
AGAVQAGANGTGLQIIAAQDDIDIQAQSDTLQVQAKDQIQVQSANAHIDWAAAKKISISTAGGANITIEGGNITTQAPGQITVHASAKVFEGPGNVGYPMPQMPRSSLPDIPAKFNMLLMDVPGPSGVALANSDWRIVHARGADEAWMTDKNLLNGTSDATGKMSLSGAQEIELKKAYDENPNNLWVVYENQVRALALTQASEDWTNQQKTNAALDAMGYSDNLGEANGDAVDDFHSPLAKIENKTRVANKLLDKIKGA